ncbi:hypothetical protein [Pseudomonas fluorescens]|uniref:Uncharacterized protein n=1 Tax=Pseudomonas fluorescens TaxID=294 RepID=A0A0F4TJ71_PSEFL|nr:hypothetical protein [Pseudomonas fluorescens]KJZ43452.1 hypothetical protein VC35_21005 [Pseudomonas fluorescens]
MNVQTLPAALTLDGEFLADAILDSRDMAYMNFAREEFNKLVQILWPLLDPLLCHEENVVASDIARHIEQVRSFSGNFCWKYRHLGASHGVVGAREGID